MIDRREVRRIARMMFEAVKLDRAYSIRAISQATKPDFQTSGSIFKAVKLDRAYSIRAISQATKPDFQTGGSIFKTERLDRMNQEMLELPGTPERRMA